MTMRTKERKDEPSVPPTPPPLQHGERLTTGEFWRRYEAMPDLKKAELIEGVVYVGSPVTIEYHGTPDSHLLTVLGTYRAFTPGVEIGNNSTVRLDKGNVVQPDGLLYIESGCGGRVKLQKGYVVGGPELAAEIAATTADYDFGKKMPLYRRNGILEYVVWRVLDRAIDWFVLRGGDYEKLPLTDGIYRSETFPGLWLDAEALLNGDLPRVHRVLQEGLASAEHQAFAADLRAKSYLHEPRP